MEELIKRVCVLILLQEVQDKSPSYIREKWDIQNWDLRGAIQSLDQKNMLHLRRFLTHWQLESPEADEILQEYGV